MCNADWGGCGVAGWGVVRIACTEIPHWRKNSGQAEGMKATSHLKLADEQAVLALAAILQACQCEGWAPTGFSDWGVLAAPRYMGRARLAHAICRFQKQGVRGMSPLTIPLLSQHSIAGVISLILGSHGPTFGVAGGSTPVLEVLLQVLSLFDNSPCPGVWAVMTAWDPEPIPDGAGQMVSPTTGIGVALALTPNASTGQVRIYSPRPALADDVVGDRSLTELADFLDQVDGGASFRCSISGGGCLELAPGPRAMSTPLLRNAG